MPHFEALEPQLFQAARSQGNSRLRGAGGSMEASADSNVEGGASQQPVPPGVKIAGAFLAVAAAATVASTVLARRRA